ncbi:hypothetical protein B296_00010566 [Ensete ventricosum]|uniref:Uncharacterized protein n=1 Tax=Ensete ventricosum TaxID=4639 RepID=A0A426Z6D0_ENSVE|nr:hypothetical protein B296_00010566 [Ensete ventricosum]
MVVDFRDDVSLVEKLVRHEVGAAKWMIARIVRPQRTTTDKGEESTPMIKSWSGAIDSVAEASIISKRLYGSRTPGLVVMDDAIARHGSMMPRWLGVEMLLWLGSSERRHCWLAMAGASATAIAATGDRLAAVEVADREEQQLGASVRGREQQLWLATVIVGAGVDGSNRRRRPKLPGSSSGSGWDLLLMEEKAAYACGDKGGRRGNGQTVDWKERSRRSDLTIVAGDNGELQLEKTISGYGFAERGRWLGINDSRVEMTRLDNIAIIVASRGLLLMHCRG